MSDVPSPGFQFNCGFDICTFPNQFCDSQENRCVPCSEDVCNAGDFSSQCKSACDAFLGSIQNPINTQHPEHNFFTSNIETLFPVTFIMVLSLLSLMLILVSGLFLYKCRRRQKGADNRAETGNINTDNTQTTLQLANSQDGSQLSSNEFCSASTLHSQNETLSSVSNPIQSSGPVTQPVDSDATCEQLHDHNILDSCQSNPTDQSPVSRPKTTVGKRKCDHL